MKIKTLKLGYGNDCISHIEVPGDDVNELSILGVELQVNYKDYIEFTKDTGNQKVKYFTKMFTCERCTIKFLKNQIEKTLMEKILRTKDIIGLTLILENDRTESYGLPYSWKSNYRGVHKSNGCQFINETDDYIELIFSSYKEGAKNGKGQRV